MKHFLLLVAAVLFMNNINMYAGDGTELNPYTIAEAKALEPGLTEFWAQGYIVGGRYNDFEAPYDVDYGISVADAIDETELTNCLQVVLLSDGGRSTWGLNSNPGNIGKLIKFKGYRDTYGGEDSFEGVDNSDISEVVSETSVETPTFSPEPGVVTEAQDITISSNTDGATIYYTLDGNEPTVASTEYTAPFEITVTTTVKAIAIKDGMDNSNVATATYSFPVEVSTIAELRSQDQGEVYKLTGEVILSYMNDYNNQKFLQDATGGIWIYDGGGVITTSYSPGDGITNIIGTLGNKYDGLIITPASDPGTATSDGNDITPIDVTIPQLTANWSEYESKLITVYELDFEDAGSTFAHGSNYNVTDASLNELVVRTGFYTDFTDENIPSTANVTGIATTYYSTRQIAPRVYADIDFATSVKEDISLIISIFPNPFSTQISVISENIESIEITNTVGQLVSKVMVNGANKAIVPTNNLANGIYIVKVTSVNGSTYTQKVIKK